VEARYTRYAKFVDSLIQRFLPLVGVWGHGGLEAQGGGGEGNYNKFSHVVPCLGLAAEDSKES